MFIYQQRGLVFSLSQCPLSLNLLHILYLNTFDNELISQNYFIHLLTVLCFKTFIVLEHQVQVVTLFSTP